MAIIELADDGTLDTVLRCTECGEEMRYNYDGETGPEDPGEIVSEEEHYDAFVQWAIEDATDEHECPTMPEAFFTDYLACALWLSTDDSREDGGDPLHRNFGPDDIDATCLANLRAECEDFWRYSAQDLEPLDAGQCGHDFWLTRNGHGAGFWDRGLGDVGKRLTDACRSYGECDLYVGDDGKLYATGHETAR